TTIASFLLLTIWRASLENLGPRAKCQFEGCRSSGSGAVRIGHQGCPWVVIFEEVDPVHVEENIDAFIGFEGCIGVHQGYRAWMRGGGQVDVFAVPQRLRQKYAHF